jgi:hypothetical protein
LDIAFGPSPVARGRAATHPENWRWPSRPRCCIRRWYWYRVLTLQEETRQLQAELARLRELAGQQPAARPARQPRPRAGGGQ